MFVDKIFKRATIRGVADYLLFGPVYSTRVAPLARVF